MSTEKPVLVFRTKDLEKTRLFYEALGLTLAEELHEGCPLHYSCDFGGLLVEFYPGESKSASIKAGNDLRFFFDTERFDFLLDVCRKLDLERGPITIRDGMRIATLHDPDGRPARVREVGKDEKAPH